MPGCEFHKIYQASEADLPSPQNSFTEHIIVLQFLNLKRQTIQHVYALAWKEFLCFSQSNLSLASNLIQCSNVAYCSARPCTSAFGANGV